MFWGKFGMIVDRLRSCTETALPVIQDAHVSRLLFCFLVHREAVSASNQAVQLIHV